MEDGKDFYREGAKEAKKRKEINQKSFDKLRTGDTKMRKREMRESEREGRKIFGQDEQD